MNPRQVAKCIAKLNTTVVNEEGSVKIEHVVGVFLEAIQWYHNPMMSGEQFMNMIKQEEQHEVKAK